MEKNSREVVVALIGGSEENDSQNMKRFFFFRERKRGGERERESGWKMTRRLKFERVSYEDWCGVFGF